MTPKTKLKKESEDKADALKFLKLYHPNVWDTVNEEDIVYILTVAHALFKTRPELLEATTQERFTPIQ